MLYIEADRRKFRIYTCTFKHSSIVLYHTFVDVKLRRSFPFYSLVVPSVVAVHLTLSLTDSRFSPTHRC